MSNIKEDITQLFSLSANKEFYQDAREDINEKINEVDKGIDNLLKDPEFKAFLNEKLQEGIDCFDLNEKKGKKGDRYNISTWSSSSSDGTTSSGETKSPNPDSPFIPGEDRWDFIKLEKNYDGLYKITVDNCKGRKYLNPFMWEPDYYYSTWFKLD